MRGLGLLVLAGCALTSKSTPRPVRYFSPAADAPAAVVAAPCARVRIGRVTPRANLRYPIEHRLSASEIAPYETLRWTEIPVAYVRRALVHALFEERPLEQAVSGRVAVLDVEVLAFEEVPRAGRVVLRYELRDDVNVLARGEVAAERPAASPAIEHVVTAIGQAMDQATGEIADRVVATACR